MSNIKQHITRSATVAVLGGDGRSRALGRRLESLGFLIRTWGLGGEDRDWQRAVKGADGVILPLPAFDREGRLSCPLCPDNGAPFAEELLGAISPGALLFGGRVDARAGTMARARGLAIEDYMTWEEVALRNAVPTAEGALYLAMGALDRTLQGMRTAVMGYGRIGQALAERLMALGAAVTVGVRRPEVRKMLAEQGIESFDVGDAAALAQVLAGCGVAFNTVPHRVISRATLATLPTELLLIELASAPGGWDPDGERACRAIYGPGLPGVYSPVTAGEIIAEEIGKRLGVIT